MTYSPVLLFLLLAIGAGAAWMRGSRGLAVIVAACAVLPGWWAVRHLPIWMLLVPGSLLVAWGWHRWSRTSAKVTRWGARSRRKSGVASSVDIARVASAAAIRRKAASVRPALSAQPLTARGRIRMSDVGVALCRVGLQRVWASIEDVTLIFGGPRTGKTGWLAGCLLDAPGAAVVTSTRTDLLELTGPLRARRGPTYVFNAVGLGGHASTITFDPLTGCADPVTAAERATDLLAAGSHGGGDREFWDTQARRVLAALMHAAALGELTMRQVLGWVADPDGAHREVTSLLRKSPAPEYVQDATQFVTTNDRTRTSITSTIMPALGWLTSPAASAAASGAHPFDVGDLLDTRATVYLLGAEETQAAPLVCALTGFIAREARRRA
ncbi:type IV secretory system conjugative DNA transfer family protein, partial [Pseudonocardia halophobica]|uniref:type IV secretory system conjugative DNA transfer family protein n=1 Tax=Pseudonocardia halophobica TaxID=29401 RepID=UPI0022F3255A